MATTKTTISFTKVGDRYEGSVTLSKAAKLHIATPGDSILSIYVKGSTNTHDVLLAQTREGFHRTITDDLYPNVFKLVCNNQPLEATYETEND